MSRPLRVLIDARMLLGRLSGVARMVTSLVERLCVDPSLHVIALCGNQAHAPWLGRSDIELLVTDFDRKHRSPVARYWWEENKLLGWIRRSGADVFHATWNHGIPRGCRVPNLLTVHDIIPWHVPATNIATWIARTAYRHNMKSSLRRTNRIAAVSGHTATEVAKTMSMDPAEIRVIYNGGEQIRPRPSIGNITRPYLLYVGGHEPRKNVEAVFAAVEAFWETHDANIDVHVTGSPGQLTDRARAVFERLGRKERVRFLGAPDDADLAREFAGATALLMLSRAEGFGLPVIEAMSHGCPVIASRSGSLPEIVGHAGVLVDPDDRDGVVNAIAQVANPEFAESLRAMGLRRAGFFTWQQAADAYMREYHRIAQRTSHAPEKAGRNIGTPVWAAPF